MAPTSFSEAASLTRRGAAMGVAAFVSAAALLAGGSLAKAEDGGKVMKPQVVNSQTSPQSSGGKFKLQSAPTALPNDRKISPAQCSVFGGYVADEADTFGTKLSATFINSIARFVSANCAAKDAKGEIHIITMTDQDAISMNTALRRTGRVDIFGISGVRHCANPPNGTCPAQTTSNLPRLGS
jgi:hypothetical protein